MISVPTLLPHWSSLWQTSRPVALQRKNCKSYKSKETISRRFHLWLPSDELANKLNHYKQNRHLSCDEETEIDVCSTLSCGICWLRRLRLTAAGALTHLYIFRNNLRQSCRTLEQIYWLLLALFLWQWGFSAAMLYCLLQCWQFWSLLLRFSYEIFVGK